MNKKGQYIEQPTGPSPLLYVGIFIFVLPLLGTIIGWNLPKWISVIGVIVILLGVGHSLLMQWGS